MTTQPRVRLLLAVLAAAWAAALLLLFLIGYRQPVQAQGDPDGVQPLGSLSGRVTDENGAPLRGIRVEFYATSRQESVRSTTTGVDGRYSAPLVTQIYAAKFSDPAGVYALQFYSGALTLADAHELSVAGNQVQNIDAQLSQAGAITGVVHVSGRANHLLAYARIDGEWQAVQEAAGWPQYEIIGLPAGRYRVCFSNTIVSSEDVVPCYKGVISGVENAADIRVAAGEVISGIDLFGDSATTLDIDGTFPYTVAAPQGYHGGITGKVADLPAYDPSEYRSVAIFTLAGGQWRVVNVVNLDPGHHYQITNLPPGTYRACLALHGYTGEDGPCYDHVRRGVQWATDISVTAGKVTTADLPIRDFVDGAAISGTITDERGAPLADVQVYLQRWIGPEWLGPLAGWYGAAYPARMQPAYIGSGTCCPVNT